MDDQLIAEFDNEFGNYVSSHGDYVDYPHAGVLNTQAFLGRYPTTETNRNRARARWTLFHFLGFDIEKSAKRTTDPEALADTNNPTLNNPACTVCHAIHDPLAGTFQNYGNSGYYRDAYGGLDSLPDTYKHPEWFDEFAEPGEYLEGDTWFRDMRIPGFEGQIAPDPANSLAWLAALIADDPRFATAAVKFWWPVLMGTSVLLAPEEASDTNFQQSLEAFEEQNSFIEILGAQFATGINAGASYNGKDHWPIGSFIVMEKSPPWGNRVIGLTDEAQNAYNINPATLERDDANGTIIYPKHIHKALRRYLGLENTFVDANFSFNNTEDFDFFG